MALGNQQHLPPHRRPAPQHTGQGHQSPWSLAPSPVTGPPTAQTTLAVPPGPPQAASIHVGAGAVGHGAEGRWSYEVAIFVRQGWWGSGRLLGSDKEGSKRDAGAAATCDIPQQTGVPCFPGTGQWPCRGG